MSASSFIRSIFGFRQNTNQHDYPIEKCDTYIDNIITTISKTDMTEKNIVYPIERVPNSCIDKVEKQFSNYEKRTIGNKNEYNIIFLPSKRSFFKFDTYPYDICGITKKSDNINFGCYDHGMINMYSQYEFVKCPMKKSDNINFGCYDHGMINMYSQYEFVKCPMKKSDNTNTNANTNENYKKIEK